MLGKSTGLFATRTPHRPCPIGLSVVKLEEVHAWGKKRYLVVSSEKEKEGSEQIDTDIVDGSPILDIKPYLPTFDRIENAITPQWVMEKGSLRDVRFSDEALSELKALEGKFRFYKTADEMHEVLLQVLGADVSKRSDRRVTKFQFDSLSVYFTAHEDVISVQHIVLTSEDTEQQQQEKQQEEQEQKQEQQQQEQQSFSVCSQTSQDKITGFAHFFQFSSQQTLCDSSTPRRSSSSRSWFRGKSFSSACSFSASCISDSNTSPFCSSTTSSPMQLNSAAQTGSPQPNMSTTFIGRSNPLLDVCRHTPRSAAPSSNG